MKLCVPNVTDRIRLTVPFELVLRPGYSSTRVWEAFSGRPQPPFMYGSGQKPTLKILLTHGILRIVSYYFKKGQPRLSYITVMLEKDSYPIDMCPGLRYPVSMRLYLDLDEFNRIEGELL